MIKLCHFDVLILLGLCKKKKKKLPSQSENEGSAMSPCLLPLLFSSFCIPQHSPDSKMSPGPHFPTFYSSHCQFLK